MVQFVANYIFLIFCFILIFLLFVSDLFLKFLLCFPLHVLRKLEDKLLYHRLEFRSFFVPLDRSHLHHNREMPSGFLMYLVVGDSTLPAKGTAHRANRNAGKADLMSNRWKNQHINYKLKLVEKSILFWLVAPLISGGPRWCQLLLQLGPLAGAIHRYSCQGYWGVRVRSTWWFARRHRVLSWGPKEPNRRSRNSPVAGRPGHSSKDSRSSHAVCLGCQHHTYFHCFHTYFCLCRL